MTEDLITTSEAARRAGLNARYISSLVKHGKITGRKVGRDWIVDAESLQAFINSQRKSGPKGPTGPKKQKEESAPAPEGVLAHA